MAQDTTSPLSAKSLLHVLEVSRKLAVPCDLHEVLELVIDAGREVLHADRGTVFLLDEERNELFSTVGTGVKDGQIRVSIDQGIVGRCARAREVINVPDTSTEPGYSRQIDQQTGYHTRSVLSVPLIGSRLQLVGVLQLLNASHSGFDGDDERIALVLASQAAVAIQRARLMEERMVKLKLERDLDLARKIQLDVLPRQLPEICGYDLAGYSQPADQTGGDIYDLVATPTPNCDATNRLVMMLADATGHGVGPALSVTQVRAMFRIGLRLSASLDDLVNHINLQLNEDLDSSRFVTAFVGMLDPVQHSVEYHAAGQGPLLHFDAGSQTCHWRLASSPPLGVLADCPWDKPPPLQLGPGDLLALLTDGIYECPNDHGECFGQPNVERVIRKHHGRSASAVLDHLLEAVKNHARDTTQQDDRDRIDHSSGNQSRRSKIDKLPLYPPTRSMLLFKRASRICCAAIPGFRSANVRKPLAPSRRSAARKISINPHRSCGKRRR